MGGFEESGEAGAAEVMAVFIRGSELPIIGAPHKVKIPKPFDCGAQAGSTLRMPLWSPVLALL